MEEIFGKMSNVFEKLMKSNENRSGSPSSSSGRPMHEHWIGYQKVNVNNKVAAKCINCQKTFTNTAKARLQKHR